VRLTRELETARDEELEKFIPAWGDGSLAPFIIETLKARGAPVAEKVLADPKAAKMAKRTAERLLGKQPERRKMPSLDKLISIMLVAPRSEDRIASAKALGETGEPAALAALRLSFAGDVSEKVRHEALKALGKAQDPEMVETAIELLARRHEDASDAAAALAALAECGDVRAKPELLRAQEEGFRPVLVKRALKAIGEGDGQKKRVR
jgi:HEAT repeat protein